MDSMLGSVVVGRLLTSRGHTLFDIGLLKHMGANHDEDFADVGFNKLFALEEC